jgi:hypothetical protein
MATLKTLFVFSCAVLGVVSGLYLGMPGPAAGTHIHFVNSDDQVVGIQHPECRGPGHTCFGVEHNCDGVVVTIVVE